MCNKAKPISDRLRAKVAKTDSPDECWEWIGATQNNGYGVLKEGAPSRKMITAHRAMWILENGPIPVGAVVLHSCDNRKCVNPAHLTLGTQSDNIKDAIAKGRFNQSRKAALTTQQANEVRFLLASKAKTQNEIAQEFGVTRTVISNIAIGKTHNQTEQANV